MRFLPLHRSILRTFQTSTMRSPNLRESFWRTLLTFNITRVVIAVLLLLYVVFGSKKLGADTEQFSYWHTCVVYLVLAISFAAFAFYYRARFVLQMLFQIAVDITAISLLYTAAGGARGGLAILYLFPLAGGAVLLPLVWALFFAAAVTLFLLGESGYQIFAMSGDATLSQSGLYGAFFFALVFLFNRLAARLINQEDLAHQRGRALQIQEAINRLVIADMGDGILVVGRDSKVQISNPAAERMLGLSSRVAGPKYRLSDSPALAPIAEAFFEWLEKPTDQKLSDASTFVVVKPGDDANLLVPTTIWGWRRELTVRLKLRFGAVKAIDRIKIVEPNPSVPRLSPRSFAMGALTTAAPRYVPPWLTAAMAARAVSTFHP